MPTVDDRYRVTIQLTVEKEKPDGTFRTYARTTQEYSHMSYEFMQRTQGTALQGMASSLIGLGDQVADAVAAARAAK